MPYYKIQDERGLWEGRHFYGGYGDWTDNEQKARIWKSLGAVKLHLNHCGGWRDLTIVEFDMKPTGTTLSAEVVMSDLKVKKDARARREELAEAERRVLEEKKKLAELQAKYGG